MSDADRYIVRDSVGAIYGPADIPTLRQWISEGRITANMQVASEGTQDFIDAAQHAELSSSFSSDAIAIAAQTSATQALGSQTTYVDTQAYPTTGATYTAGGYPQAYPQAYPRSSGMAIAALIAGVLSIGCLPGALVAIILGHMARGQIRREPERYDGYGMATAGMIMGYIFAGIVALLVLLYILIVVLAIAGAAAGSR